MKSLLSNFENIAPGLSQAFAGVAQNVADGGYRHFALLPRSELQIASQEKLRLTMPYAEKTEINVTEVSQDFVLSALSIKVIHKGPRIDIDNLDLQFAAFKTPAERDAFIKLVNDMDFFNKEKVYVMPYEYDEATTAGVGKRQICPSYASYDPKAF